MEKIIEFATRLIERVTTAYIAIGASAIIAVTFIVFLFFESRKNFIWFSLFTMLTEFLAFYLGGKNFSAEIIYLTLSGMEIIVFNLLLSMPTNRKIKKSKIDSFIKSLETELKETKKQEKAAEEIKEPLVKEDNFPLKRLSNISSLIAKDVDYQHAKSLVNRLSYYDMTAEDKTEVENIEKMLNISEKEKFQSKRELNEKLAGLIKILAKYQIS